MAESSMSDKIALAALKNTTVQNAVKKSLFESVMGKEQVQVQVITILNIFIYFLSIYTHKKHVV